MEKKTRLQQILSDLKVGEPLLLSEAKNQQQRWVPNESLSFVDGEWWLHGINCFSSIWLDMGTCRCESHSHMWTQKINRREALAAIRRYIEQKVREQATIAAEIAWLDRAIEEAP